MASHAIPCPSGTEGPLGKTKCHSVEFIQPQSWTGTECHFCMIFWVHRHLPCSIRSEDPRSRRWWILKGIPGPYVVVAVAMHLRRFACSVLCSPHIYGVLLFFLRTKNCRCHPGTVAFCDDAQLNNLLQLSVNVLAILRRDALQLQPDWVSRGGDEMAGQVCQAWISLEEILVFFH